MSHRVCDTRTHALSLNLSLIFFAKRTKDESSMILPLLYLIQKSTKLDSTADRACSFTRTNIHGKRWRKI